MKRVVLAYSGGLDTSCAIKWFKLKGFEVVCFSADLGQESDFGAVKKRALAAGASKVYIRDLNDEFMSDYVLPALKANAVYENKYVLATALGRPLIAKHLVDVARKEKADFVSHGCTGKGNDQVRIEVGVNTLAPSIKIIAPLRDWEFKSREEEIDFALKHKIPIDVTKKKPYSIDKNHWGVSIEAGILEDPCVCLPEDAYQMTVSPLKAKNKPEHVDVEFLKGVPVALNGRKYKLLDLVMRLNDIGGRNGVGRSDMIENRLVGIKSREVYEAPAATILLGAHRELEALVLDRELTHFKESISLKYSELVYNGLWFSPLRRSLDAFIESTQSKVSGTVRMRLFKGSSSVAGRRSPNSLYKKELATYSQDDKFDHKLAEGFIKLWGLPYRVRS